MTEIVVEPAVITRNFEAPMQLVYEAWTQENHLCKWQTPNANVVCEYQSADIKTGGSALHKMVMPNGHEMWLLTQYHELTPFTTIVFRQYSSNEAGEKLAPPMPNWPKEIEATIRLSEAGGVTHMEFIWQPINPTQEEAECWAASHAQGAGGWAEQFRITGRVSLCSINLAVRLELAPAGKRSNGRLLATYAFLRYSSGFRKRAVSSMQLFVNDLTVMDFSYLCEQRGIVGESWIVDVVLDGDLNDESMVLDFGLVKKQLKRLIDEHVDHKLLVPLENPITTATPIDGNVRVDFQRLNQRSIHFNCPKEAYAFLYSKSINREAVAEYLRCIIENELPVNVEGLHISLREEVITTPYYHYSHGLKKHDGNCQRIAMVTALKLLSKKMVSAQPLWKQNGVSDGVIFISAPKKILLAPLLWV